MIEWLNVTGAAWSALVLGLAAQGTFFGLPALALARRLGHPRERSLLLLVALAAFLLPASWLVARVAPSPVSVVLRGDPGQAGLHWPAMVMLVHALGIAVVGLRTARQARYLARLRSAAEPTGLGATAATEARLLALSRVPPVLEADVPAPFVSGALLPVIVLPYRLAQQLSATQLAHVLRHEMWHVRQHDVWINWLLALVRVGFWFHPLPRLLGRRLREAREECCDDAVLAGDPAAAGGYARTLLRVAEIAAGGAPPPSLAFAMADHEFAAIQARIRRVLRRDPTQRAPGPLRRLGLLLGCLAFAAAATWLCPTVRAVPAPAATGAALTPSPAGHAATHAARHAIRHRH